MAEESKPPVPPSPEGEAKPTAETANSSRTSESGFFRQARNASVARGKAGRRKARRSARNSQTSSPGRSSSGKASRPSETRWTSANAVDIADGRKVQEPVRLGRWRRNPISARTISRVDRSLIPNILRLLRDEEHFDYCVDITAVALSQARKAIRSLLDSLFLRAQRAHPRKNANRRRRVAALELSPSGRPRTGWSAKSTTCSASSSTAIPT